MDNRQRVFGAAAVLFALLLSPLSVRAQQPAQTGMLTCQLNPSIGFIIGGVQTMRCRYVPNGPLPPQAYVGEMGTIGPDIGITAGGVLAWAVLAPLNGPPPGGLAGVYVGASGDVAVGVGAGANLLIGGSNRTNALQPLSVEGEVGLAVSLGISSLKLMPAY
jgi:hypothetical protein